MSNLNTLQKTVLKIVTIEAVKTIAKSQGTTNKKVRQAIKENNQVVCEQFQKLILIGWGEASDQIKLMAS